MKPNAYGPAICALASLCLALPPALAQQDGVPEYNPPTRGAPAGRVGGGTRGLRPLPLAVLSPDHTGLTISAQPALYYFAPGPSVVRVTLRPASDPAARPLLEKELSPARAGIQRLDLRSLGVSLAPGIEYRWSVASGDSRSSSSGAIRRIEPPAELQRKLAAAQGARGRYMLLAREGVWYDALDEVSRAVDAAPANPVPARHRAALLEQIGLKDIARSERQRYE